MLGMVRETAGPEPEEVQKKLFGPGGSEDMHEAKAAIEPLLPALSLSIFTVSVYAAAFKAPVVTRYSWLAPADKESSKGDCSGNMRAAREDVNVRVNSDSHWPVTKMRILHMTLGPEDSTHGAYAASAWLMEMSSAATPTLVERYAYENGLG